MLIKPYNKDWEIHFNQLKSVLLKQVRIEGVYIEHIGSTSVPGLDAKAIIDMDMVYHKPADFEQIKNDLEHIGYYHNGDQGIPGREVFKRRPHSAIHPVLDSIVHHLYLCHEDNEELKRHLIVRDALKQSEEARMAYSQLKQTIAEQAMQDKKKYALLKEEGARAFFERLIRKGRNL